MFTVSVEWGYELHSIDLSNKVWKEIQSGKHHVLESTGYYEGEEFEITWNFNSDNEVSAVTR